MTLEDLEDQVKFMVEKFQNSIKSFEEHSVLVQKNIDNTADLASKMNALADNGQNTTQKATDLGQKVENQGRIHQSLLADLSSNIKQLWTNHVDISQDLTTAKAFANAVDSKLEASMTMMKGFLKSEDVKPLYNEIASLKDKFPALAIDYDKDKTDILALITNLKSDFSSLPSSIQDLESKVVSTISNLQAVINDVANIRTEFKSSLSSLSASFDAKLKEQISAIPVQDAPSLDDTKKVMTTMVEPMAVDAKNASLRSASNESKISLLEKKLEQLQILVNTPKV